MNQTMSDSKGYLEALCDKHGVSRQFLDALRPTVEKIFNDVPAERRDDMLGLLEQTVARQAETETILESATAKLSHLRALNRKDGIGVESSRRAQPVHGQRARVEQDSVRQAV